MGITDKIFEKMTDRKGLFQGGVEGEGFATQGRIFGRLRDKLEGKESAGYHNPDLE